VHATRQRVFGSRQQNGSERASQDAKMHRSHPPAATLNRHSRATRQQHTTIPQPCHQQAMHPLVYTFAAFAFHILTMRWWQMLVPFHLACNPCWEVLCIPEWLAQDARGPGKCRTCNFRCTSALNSCRPHPKPSYTKPYNETAHVPQRAPTLLEVLQMCPPSLLAPEGQDWGCNL